MLQPDDVVGLAQARRHRLAYLQPLANVPAQKAPVSQQDKSGQWAPQNSQAAFAPSHSGPSFYLGSTKMSMMHFRWGATVVQF